MPPARAPYLNGKTYRYRVPRSDGRTVRVSLDTRDWDTAVAMGRMIETLADRGESPLLDAICDRQAGYSVMGLWTQYRTDPTLRSAKDALDDVDLSPLVGEWDEEMRKAAFPSGDRYVEKVRRLIAEDVTFGRSRFRRKVIAKHLATLTHLANGPHGREGAPLSNASRNRHRAALSQFARWLIDREIIEHNPVRDLDMKAEKPRDVYLTPAENKVLIGALTDPYQALEAIMAGTGMEWSAIVRTVSKRTGIELTPGLRRRDLDFAAKTIWAHGGKNAWRNRKCHVTERWTWPVIERYARDFTPNALLFEDLSHEVALQMHHAAAAAAHLPHSVLHDHRHSYAYATLSRGMRPMLVARQEGHADETLVVKRYGKYIPRDHEYAPYIEETGTEG